MTKRKRRLKRAYGISTILLALLILFVPQLTRAADPIEEDTDGEIKWKIEGDTLTISAVPDTDGEIKEYNYDEEGIPPWSESQYIDNVKKVVITEGVTSLGRMAFAFSRDRKKPLDKVVIPGSVEVVGEHAAEGLRTKELEFKEGVTTIENTAFRDCVANKITFPSTIEEIEYNDDEDIEQFRINGDQENYRISDVYGYSGTAAETFVETFNQRVLFGWISLTGPDDQEYLNFYKNTGDHEYVRGATLIRFHRTESNPPAQPEPDITVVDRRGANGQPVEYGEVKKLPIYSDSSGITVSVKDLKEKLYLFVRDKDSIDKITSEKLRNLVKIKDGGRMEWYDISLQNGEEKVSHDFGTCTITLPIPGDMDLTKGKVKAVTIKSNSTLESPETKIVEINGNTCAEFKTDHFSNVGTEFGLLYSLNGSAESDSEESSDPDSKKPDSSQASSTEENSSEAGSTEASSTEASSSEAGSTEASSTEASSSEASSTEASSSEASSTEASSSEASSTEASSTASSTESKAVKQEIKDERTSTAGISVVSFSVTSQKEDLQLHVGDSAGENLKKLVAVGAKDKIVYLDLSLTDANGAAASDFGSCTITLQLPLDWDLSNGNVEVKSVKQDGALETIKATTEVKDDKIYAKFTTMHFSEYGLLYSSIGTEPTVTVVDKRKDQPHTECLSATVTTLTEDLFLYERDASSEGKTSEEKLKNLVTINEGGRMEWYDITLKKGSGEDAKDFGSCTLIMPIPTDMDTTKGTVKAVTVSPSGTLEELVTAVIDVKGVKCVRFTTTHFSEYGLVYAPNASGGSKGKSEANKPSAAGKKKYYNDMPRTGSEDVIRVLFAMALFLFGVIELITSIHIGKEKS